MEAHTHDQKAQVPHDDRCAGPPDLGKLKREHAVEEALRAAVEEHERLVEDKSFTRILEERRSHDASDRLLQRRYLQGIVDAVMAHHERES